MSEVKWLKTAISWSRK